MVLGVGEADEGQVVASEGLRGRKALDGSFVLDVVEVPGVVVAGQLVDDRWHVVADGREVPDVVLEEGMLLDLVDAAVAQPTSSGEKGSSCNLKAEPRRKKSSGIIAGI